MYTAVVAIPAMGSVLTAQELGIGGSFTEGRPVLRRAGYMFIANVGIRQ